MLVRAVGGAPLWKESAVVCIVGSRMPARDDFEVWVGNVVGPMTVRRVGVSGEGGGERRRKASRMATKET